LPRELRAWQPKTRLDYKLPPPDDEYWELEAMKAFGYRLDQWEAEDPLRRARLIAHQHEVTLRQAHFRDWEQDQMSKGEKRDERGQAWSAMKSQWGLT